MFSESLKKSKQKFCCKYWGFGIRNSEIWLFDDVSKIINLKIFKTQNHKIIYVTTIVSATLAIQHDSHNYTHGIVDDLLDLNKEIASSLGLHTPLVTKTTGEKVFLTYRGVRLLR